MTTWNYINNTTGAEMLCNDLGYLIYNLIEVRKLKIPKKFINSLIAEHELNCMVKDKKGKDNHIFIWLDGSYY
jgi:hypothetical protein